MYSSIRITMPDGKAEWRSLNFTYTNLHTIDIPNVCFIRVYKQSNHSYELKCYIHKSNYICVRVFRTKTELIKHIQDVVK